ncbi:DUF397 domain-containing protein [Spiractinospora alimapuensis]|uniref:DUF397 domain-containing protein n=1 Tax=Spiractinospora alimapuensis TaxID=2820884 RepID=UPI001F2FACEA|nr:DUF397 domain-containing protein [Spiractinospora alimapuensis]
MSSQDPLAQWRTSSYSAKYNCVQCASGIWTGTRDDRDVAVRDSQNPTRGRLRAPVGEWVRFLGAVRQGVF